MVKKEMAGLEAFLLKHHIDPSEAKTQLKAIRDQKSREYSTFSHDFSGTHIKIGVVGDTHFGNKWTVKAFLRDVMAEYKKQKVDAVYHPGDTTDGPWQRHKNILEQYAHGIEDQVDDFVEDFPDIGIPIYIIDGNHDGWYIDNGSGSPGRRIAERRSDITYLGRQEAIVKFGKITMMISHPEDGSAYAYSYKGQKKIESMVKMGEDLPNLLLQGHYHKLLYMNTSGLHYFMTGTTEKQTPWMRGKNIAADMGAWTIDIFRDRRGNITRLEKTLLPYIGDRHTRAIR